MKVGKTERGGGMGDMRRKGVEWGWKAKTLSMSRRRFRVHYVSAPALNVPYDMTRVFQTT